jgi:hypothetical protein
MLLKSTVCSLMILLGAFLPQSVTAQTLREFVRAQAQRGNVGPFDYPAPPGHYEPKTIEQLAQEASLVVRGRLVRGRSHLGPGETTVLTDYSIVSPEIVAGSVPLGRAATAGAATRPMTVAVRGGEVTVEGAVIRAGDQNFEPIQDGREYLMFLRPSRAPQAAPTEYEIYYGGIFETSQQSVKPLLKESDRVFRDAKGQSTDDLIGRVNKARQNAGGRPR